MERLRNLSQIWSWLPAFRAVAETEHLGTAAKAMHVSPSALSRSVTQLEAALGHALFTRTGRRLRLTSAGGAMLAASRDAMRRLDDGLRAIEPGRQVGAIRVHAGAPWVGVVLAPAADATHATSIDLVELGGDPSGPLLRGEIDLAIVERVAAHPELETRLVCDVPRAVCCRPDHAASRRRRGRGAAVELSSLAAHPFAATIDDDGWPGSRVRDVRIRSRRIEPVLEACASGTCLAALPLALAETRGLSALAPLPPTTLYLQRRRPLAADPALDGLVAAVLAAGGRLAGRPVARTGSGASLRAARRARR
jgi:DNA-binding transcriptional LysR family regulator